VGYSLLYLNSDQQLLFFPLIFWVLAGDCFDTAQSKRIFPLIASFGFAGKLIGIALAALSPGLVGTLLGSSADVLVANVVIYLAIGALICTRAGTMTNRQRRSQNAGVHATLVEGWDFVRAVPAFRYLTVAIVALVACDLMLEFRFYTVSDQVFPNTESYQTFYSLYRLGFTIIALVVEGVLAGRLLTRLGLKATFFIRPCMALVGALWVSIAPSLPSAVGGMALQKLPQMTIDENARKSFQTLIPEERRGRVAILMDVYLYALGSILGSLVVGAVVIVGAARSETTPHQLYLAVAIAAAAVALWAVAALHRTYDTSLLNWRLHRRQRATAVLDRLQF
jgi:ATP/ADP translocase